MTGTSPAWRSLFDRGETYDVTLSTITTELRRHRDEPTEEDA